jgi:hypothetical protein
VCHGGFGQIERAALAVGVGGFVQRFHRAEDGAGARIDEIDTAQIPTGVAKMHVIEMAIARGDLEAPAGETRGAIGAAESTCEFDAKGRHQFRGDGTGASDVGAGQLARIVGAVKYPAARIAPGLQLPGQFLVNAQQ